MSDRVSWRRAWSLFYKFLIMQTVAGIVLWLIFLGIVNSKLNSTQKISTNEINYSKFDTCFAEALENNKDVTSCDKYLPSK
jgi:hypothetical protein